MHRHRAPFRALDTFFVVRSWVDCTTSMSGFEVVICEPSPAFQLTPRDDQLMSVNRILRLKPALRLEWRGQHGQNKPNQRDHRANLADSVNR
jgi:hypothetical protein